MKSKTKRQLKRVGLLWLPMLLFLIFIGIPLFWALSLSFRDGNSIISGEFRLFPNPITITNYIYVWVRHRLSGFFINSLLFSFGAVIVIAVLSLFNGYALSRFDFKTKQVFMILLLMTQMIPIIFNMSSIYLLMSKMKLTNSTFGIILLYIASNLSYNSLMMKSFIGAIPKEIDEAASIDGCNQIQIIFKVILPSVMPGFTTVIAYAFINCWNEYLLAYTLLTDSKKFPISVGLKYLVGEYSTNYAVLAAGSVIALIPPILLFAYVQKNLVSGMSSGAVKG